MMLDRITSDPAICGGKPCIRGTRMRVVDVLELLAVGASNDEILEDYPWVELEDIRACLQFAAEQARHPIVAIPPETPVLWIRLGNCRKPRLLAAVIPKLGEIETMFDQGAGIVEIR